LKDNEVADCINVTDVSEEQDWKAAWLMVVTEDGMSTDANEEH
jgi:hypothetical protein